MLEKKRKIKRNMFPNNPTHRVIWSGKTLKISYVKEKNTLNTFTVIGIKKNFRTIVERNKFKKRVYFSIKQFLNKFDELYSGKFIISSQQKAIYTFHMIQNDLFDFLNKNDLFRNKTH